MKNRSCALLAASSFLALSFLAGSPVLPAFADPSLPPAAANQAQTQRNNSALAYTQSPSSPTSPADPQPSEQNDPDSDEYMGNLNPAANAKDVPIAPDDPNSPLNKVGAFSGEIRNAQGTLLGTISPSGDVTDSGGDALGTVNLKGQVRTPSGKYLGTVMPADKLGVFNRLKSLEINT